MTTFSFTTSLITGALSGIGEATANKLGWPDVPTVLVARRRGWILSVSSVAGFQA